MVGLPLGMIYDPEEVPDPMEWLALDEQERITAALQSHLGCFPDALHTADANPIPHGGLHAVIETQIASNTPPITAQTLARLEKAGLRRHAAVHLLMREMAQQIAALRAGQKSFDAASWEQALSRLSAVSSPPRSTEKPLNRAERRKALKARRKRK